jgi:hypothetical protein
MSIFVSTIAKSYFLTNSLNGQLYLERESMSLQTRTLVFVELKEVLVWRTRGVNGYFGTDVIRPC